MMHNHIRRRSEREVGGEKEREGEGSILQG